MPDLDAIRCALATYEPKLTEQAEKRAAVALVLRNSAKGPETLFIERARHPADPWSGHMAFPGGRVEPDDASARAAAERETREEVGLDLARAELLGRLDDLEGRHAGRRSGLVISAFVYHHPEPGPLRPNHEVATAFWVPVPSLRDPFRHVDHAIHDDLRPFPGIRVSEADPHVVWGLTYRFVELFLEIVGKPLPDRWQAFP
jgi:8-oxo-dGTP pyrophosphatase MutT (NUDIX family)